MAIQVQDPPRNILTFPMQIPMHWLLYPGPHSGAFSHPSLFKPAVIPHWGHSQETLLRTAYYIHLSYPKYRPTSVTAHVPPESYSLQYINIDHAIAILQDLGPECFMSQLDIKSAFRNVPVHLSDWELLGWNGRGSISSI